MSKRTKNKKNIKGGNSTSDWIQMSILIGVLFIIISFGLWCYNNEEKCNNLFFNKEGNFSPNFDKMSFNPSDYKIGSSNTIEPKTGWDRFTEGASNIMNQAASEVKEGYNAVKKDFR